MSTPVYLLVFGKGYTEAWYRLSKAEQDSLWAKVQEVDTRVGAKWQIAPNRTSGGECRRKNVE